MRAPARLLPALAVAWTLVAGGPSRADQVIAEDLVLQGSDCIGFDCVMAEAFLFETIRMKENNLRIHFDDTTDPLAGPSTDWRLTANDSASGGPSYLRFEDATSSTFPVRIDSGAPTDSLVVAGSGSVGVGTGTPTARLHTAGSVRVTGDLLVIASAQSSGVVPASALIKRAGSVAFAAPQAGPYAIALTPIGATPTAKLEVRLTARDADGFAFAVSGKLKDLSGVAWTIRAVTEP
jgi:hypothetical protein